MLNFKPLNDAEIQALSLIPPGEYPFKVKFAEAKISQSGNPQIKIILAILADGRERNVYDYLMTIESMLFKLRHFCYATGLDQQYEAGTLTADNCLNRTGTCKIGVKEDKTGKFLPTNIVLDYIKSENVSQTPAPAAFNDDIPF